MKDSDVDSVVRLKSDVSNSPTPATPAVAEPAAATDDTAEIIAARKLFQEQTALVRQVRKDQEHRRWTKAIREHILEGKANYFKADGKDDAKLGKIVVYLKTQFQNAGLDVSPFINFDDVTKEVLECTNTLVYDTLFEVIQRDSAADIYFVDTDSAFTQDGRRAILYLTSAEDTHRAKLFERFEPDVYAGINIGNTSTVDKEDVEMAPASVGAPSFHAVNDSFAPASAPFGRVRIEGDGWLRDATVAARASARHLASVGGPDERRNYIECCAARRGGRRIHPQQSPKSQGS
ncbi:hypothetical protein CYMTET_17628 [Cymbomonas tetramitiformis]|uniref:Uncharacterized protein n=1 Tax=Cymbomonas tetramitiformis TaxID=36881 RepID=A0AAE0G9Y6_9CHLO|nr:hypothetical protein CYMTET_17628 [Cymbomonas tetramitiformis]